MAKQQDHQLKRVESEVSVNCCDGCRSKVLKALNLKGVLTTEVHPTAPDGRQGGRRRDVDANVAANRLVKRLARVGKIAEVIAQSPPEGGKRRHDGGGLN
uniref:HMA domain-containing protein n=1 Tax=Oryza brachyantha TaxID=4533 RepID=J3MR73_ORYBR